MKRPPAPPNWHDKLTTVGVTGTNGKTSTTAFVAAALRTLGHPVPRLTTVGKFLDDALLDVPDGYDGFLEAMRHGVRAGATHAAAEYTSEALKLGIALAWPVKVAVFTNLTRDHLDAHGSAEDYLASKAQLFAHLMPGGAAVLNACDAAGELLAQVVPAGTRVVTYGSSARGQAWCEPTLRAASVSPRATGTEVQLVWSVSAPVGAPDVLSLRSIGDVFVENAMAALLAAHAAGADVTAAATAIGACPAPPGRFEVVATSPCVVVDYAHTPDALARTIETARAIASDAGGKVGVVFGAGGDRDKGKRPQMGAAASGADRIWLTTDNPRTEDPGAIAGAIRAGIPRGPAVEVELDRRRAIERAVREAGPGDVVVIAGKGHERGQIVGGEVRPFSDVEVAEGAVRLR